MTDEQTPNGTEIYAHMPDNTRVNVTEAVMAMYDLVIGGMDWGSGLWTVEDAQPVGHLADLCGFEQAEEVQRYIDVQQHSEEQTRFLATLNRMVWHRPGPPEAHDHVFSTVGKCMWPRCTETNR